MRTRRSVIKDIFGFVAMFFLPTPKPSPSDSRQIITREEWLQGIDEEDLENDHGFFILWENKCEGRETFYGKNFYLFRRPLAGC